MVISLVTVSLGSRASYSAWIERWRLRAVQFDDLEEVDVVISEISNIGSNKIRTIFDTIWYHEHFLFFYFFLFGRLACCAVLCCALRENEKEMERKGFGFWVPGQTRHRIEFTTLSCLQSPLWNGGMDSK